MTASLPEGPARAAAPSTSIWEDFADIFVSPRSVFERRRDGRFGMALLVLSIVVGVISWAWAGAMLPAIEAQFAAQMEQLRQSNPAMTQEQLAQARSLLTGTFRIFSLFATPIMVLLMGFAIWVLGMLFGWTGRFAIAMVVATYSQFPRILKSAVETVQAVFADPATLDSVYRPTLSPARFLDPQETSLALIGLAGRFDVFVIWMTVLIALGLHVAAGMSKRNATIAAIIIWALGGLAAVGQVARGG